MENKIVRDLKDYYGITCLQIFPINGGLLNKKWRITTLNGEILVKQYSLERFDKEKLDLIESRLKLQVMLKKIGFDCPLLWQHGKQIIRWADKETPYIVMEFCNGSIINSDTISIPQMYSLGLTCATLHENLTLLSFPKNGTLPKFGGYTYDTLLNTLSARLEECLTEESGQYTEALRTAYQNAIMLTPNFFEECMSGYAHEDFHSGNILFDDTQVKTVLDFDRCCWSYPLHDVGRAILSFAFDGNQLDMEKVIAFKEGYSQHFQINMSDIVDALKLTWCIECVWWIQKKYFENCDQIPKRFLDEILWINGNWSELNTIMFYNTTAHLQLRDI